MTAVPDAPSLTAEQAIALDHARALAAAGVPIFVAEPDPAGHGHSDSGFWLPTAWQQTPPDPAAVDRWRPGAALCAVMGAGIDLLDVDPRNGGDLAELGEHPPRSHGIAATPSGGMHSFIAALGAGSHDGVHPGIDVKGGFPDGSSRGFAFLPPTVKRSKVTGEPAPYRWLVAPDLDGLDGDRSGAALADRVRAVRGSGGARAAGGPDWWQAFITNTEPQSAAAADRAVGEKLDEITAWDDHAGSGFRGVLMRAAMTLGGYVGGGWLDEAAAWARLEDAVSRVWGSPDADDRRWIEQGLTDGSAMPFYVYTPQDEAEYGEAAQAVAATRSGPAWSPYRALGTEPFDPGPGHDQEHAEAVLTRAMPVLRYGSDTGTWLRRRRHDVWSEMPGPQAASAVADVARLMPLGDTPVPEKKSERTAEHWQAVRRAAFLSSAGASKIERKIGAVVSGGSFPAALDVADLDTEPEVLWAGGVPWDLRSSGREPVASAVHPDTPHLHTAACAPDPSVPTPRWDAFVAAVWPDPEIRAWALRVLSICLTGHPDAALPVLYGPQRSGKSSVVSLLVDLLGTYGHSADPRLLGGADQIHASVVYALKGRRLSFIDEGPRAGHLATERLKQLTGGAPLTGNAMRSNPITFSPTHTLVMTTNDEPPITDPALRARIRLVPCEQPEGEVRPARMALTPAAWELEAPGVLAAMMAQAAAWLADRDSASPASAPASVRSAIEEMAAEQSPVDEWVSLCTVPADPGTPSRALHRRFLAWFEGQPAYRRKSPPSLTAFGTELTGLGYPWHWGGDRGKTKFRPLSVMEGGFDSLPSGPGVTAIGSSTPYGADTLPTPCRQSDGQVSASSNPSSTPVFSSSADSADSSSSNTTTKTNTHSSSSPYGAVGGVLQREMGAPSEVSAEPRDLADENSGSPATTPVADTPADSVGRPSAGESETACREEPPVPGVSDTDGDDSSGRSERNREIRAAARLADQEKITKAEARARVKAEKLAAAVSAAGGEVHALPAVVDRDGHVLPISAEQARAVLDSALARFGALTVDVETSGFPVGHEHYRLRSIQLGDATAAVVLDPDDPAQADLARAALAGAPVLHAHSATADLVPLAVAGLVDHDEAWTRMHDTVLPAKLADPASTGSDPGLKGLASSVLGDRAVAPGADEARSALFRSGKWLTNTKPDTPPERSGWAQVPKGSTTMIRYAASDVLDTALLALKGLEGQTDPAVHERERAFQAMTARVAHRGVRIDAAHVEALTATHTAAADELAARIRERWGVDNPASSAQVGDVLGEMGATLPQTPGGRPSAAAAVLEGLRGQDGPIGECAAEVLDFRHHRTVLSLFLEPYRLLCERGDGRARPTIYTLSADTGRTSATRPNIQQLPRTGGTRACLTADPGQLMVGADFSSVELRVAAALSQDPTLLAFLRDGRDLHREVARQVWGPDAGKAERYRAKPMVFGRLYGSGAPGMARTNGVSVETAQAVIDALDRLTPGLTAWSEMIRDAVRRGHTRFPTYSGRVVHLPADRPHAGPNFAIQGTARELLVDAYLRLRETGWGTCVNFPVHDEIDLFVAEAEADEATAALVGCMETDLFGVAITAEASAPAFAWQDST